MPNLPMPLLGAAPTLQPTARPIAVPVAVRPPAQRSPLMDLAQSFSGFNDELRNLLRDTAARADRDAMAMGELDAMKTSAAANMASIDVKLKEAVDARKLDPIRRVAYQQAFSARAGADLAQTGFQTDLDAALAGAIKGTPADTEKAVQTAYQKWASQLRPDDLHMADAFSRTAQGVITGFRQRVSEGQTAEYRKNSQQAIADEGSEIAFRIATASEADLPGLHAALKTHLDAVRSELPKSDVNPFFVKNVAAPAIDKLVTQRKFAEADQLLDEMDRLDVTGSGGMLGSTAVAKAVFSDLRSRIDRESRSSHAQEAEDYNRSRQLEITKGVDAAGAALNKIQLGTDGRLDPDARFKLVEDYRKAHADSPLLTQGFEDAVNRAYENQDRWRANDRLISDLTLESTTLNKDQLDTAEAKLELAYHAGEVPPQARTQIRQNIDKLRALYGALDEGDFRQMKRDLYAFKDVGGIATVNFGDTTSNAPDASANLWAKLPQALQDEHEQQTTAFFDTAVQAELRKLTGGDPNKVPTEKFKALDNATIKTREFARTLLLAQVGKAKDVAKAREVADHAALLERAARARALAHLRDAAVAGPFAVSPNFDYTEPDAKGVPRAKKFEPDMKNRPRVLTVVPPRAGSQPMPEADTVDVYFPANSIAGFFLPGPEGTSRVVSLPELVTTMSEGSPEVAAKARDTYAFVKGRMGFTPEEIKKGVTKHGVSFTPSEIDPNYITLFRDRAELDKHWNDGKPDEVFNALGSAVDPKDRMTAKQFYLAQLALLSR